MSNIEQEHKKWVAEVFDRASSGYGTNGSNFFNYFGKQLVDKINFRPRDSILDIATGKGAVLFSLLERARNPKRIVAIDISKKMIEETARELVKKNINSVELLCMDAEKLDFQDNSFDIISCGFALFFLPSIQKALREFRRVLKKGGILAVSIWGKDSVLDILVNEALKPFGPQKTLAPTSLWSEEELRASLEEVGFRDISICEEKKDIFYNSPQEWWDNLWDHGTRSKLERLTAPELEEVRKTVLKEASQYVTGDLLREDLQVFYGIAKSL